MTAELPPDEATLRRFLLGDLPPAELEAVGRYLEEHPQAASTLVGLKADDTLLSALRGAAEASDAPEVAAAVARAAGLVGDTTPTGDATAAPDAADDDGDDPFAALAPAEADGELGRLGGYRVLRLLGRGGMGAVFEAADDRLGRRVALKIMLPGVAARPSARQRFLREAKAAAAVECDYIVPIYQTGEDRGVPFLAMPLLAGESLDDRLHGGRPLAVADILRIGREVAEGLAAAHAVGLVHRDIKPSNVWLERTADGAFKRTRILDFGLARTTTGADGLTASGAILGTPAYMAPEQARGQALDHRADLFSLGCVLYHAATGRRPFPGADAFSVLTALATTEPTPAAEVNPAVSPGLSALITRLLAKDPAGRPATARAVADELVRLAAEPARDSITHVVAAGPVAPRADGRAGSDTTEAFDPAPPRRVTRRRWRVAAAVLFLAAAGLAAANGKTVVRVVTNQGELVVEVDDPATEVAVKGGAVELRREENGKKRVYLVTATKDGEVEVREPGSEMVLVMEKFQVRRGGDVLVKVTADKLAAARGPKAGIPATGTSAADQRKALEWVLSVGGFFSVNDPPRTVRPGDAIPAGPLDLHVIWLGDCKGVNDTSIENLRSVSPVKEVSGGVNLSGTSITDIGLAKLAAYPGFSGIWELRLGGTGVTDEGMTQLKHFPQLTELQLGDTRITDAGLEHIRGLKLHNLNIHGCRSIAGAGFVHLRDMTTLKGLGIGGCPVVGANLAHLKGLKLEGLTAGYQHGDGTAVGDAGLEHLGEMTSLTQLDLPSTGITDKGLARLQKLTKLGRLDLHGNPGITGASGETLAHLTSLKHLHLNTTGTSDAGLAKLTTLKELQELKLGSTKVTDAGLAQLAALPKLRDLHLGQNAGVTDAGLKHFRDYSALAELSLGETSITDAGLDHLAGVKTLRTVHCGLTKVTETGVKKLAAARPDLRITWDGPTIEPKASPASPPPEQRKALEWVLAGGGSLRIGVGGKSLPVVPGGKLPDGPFAVQELQAPAATDDTTIENLRTIPTLAGPGSSLDVRGTKITAAGLAKLATFPTVAALAQLRLSETATTDAGLAHVKRFEKLSNLDLRNTRVTDAGLTHLRDLKLEHLDLAGCDGVTGTGFVHLRGMTTLRTLDIYRCPVPGERLAELKGLKLEAFYAGNCRTLGDAGLTHLAAVASLKTLGLSVTTVTDQGVKGLQNLRGLTTLDLGYNAGVTDTSAGVIAGLPALESLTLIRTGLTDRGLERLAACKSLKELDVRATTVTVAGVRALAAALPACKIQADGVTIAPAGEGRP